MVSAVNSMPMVLYALGDTFRLQIVARLMSTDEKLACQDFFSDEMIAKSTLSHHFKVLREAGLVRMVLMGRRAQVSLRHEDLEARFPGLIDAILNTYHQQPAPTIDFESRRLDTAPNTV
jgi:DNA-binding transcriptional ArsR family regulator